MIISTYRYKDPADVGDLTIRKAGPEGDDLDEVEANEVLQEALLLLRELQAKPR